MKTCMGYEQFSSLDYNLCVLNIQNYQLKSKKLVFAIHFEIQLEKVYYLLELETTSLKCEKDFLLTSLDEIDALIFQKQEEATMKTSDHPTKRLAKPIDAPHPKKSVTVQEKMDLEKTKELNVQEDEVYG